MKQIMLFAAICGAAAALASERKPYSEDCRDKKDIIVKDGDSIAFLGDSITYAGNSPAGYVGMVMKGLEVAGVKSVKKIPAGISGHKSNNMLERVDRDCLAKKPTFMTVSCGVNDVWHGKNGVPLEDYKKNMSAILDKAAASNVTVIVLTPTMIGENRDNADNRKLGGYISWLLDEAVRRKLAFADLHQDMCDEITRIKAQIVKSGGKPQGNLLTRDGVHMAFKGNCLMAWGILKAMGVPESKKDEIYAAWRMIPEAHSVNVPLSEEEMEALKRKAGGMRLAEFIREVVVK